MNQLTINQIAGMNTFNSFANEKGVADPSKIVDAVPHENGRLIARDGTAKVISLSDGAN